MQASSARSQLPSWHFLGLDAFPSAHRDWNVFWLLHTERLELSKKRTISSTYRTNACFSIFFSFFIFRNNFNHWGTRTWDLYHTPHVSLIWPKSNMLFYSSKFKRIKPQTEDLNFYLRSSEHEGYFAAFSTNMSSKSILVQVPRGMLVQCQF